MSFQLFFTEHALNIPHLTHISYKMNKRGTTPSAVHKLLVIHVNITFAFPIAVWYCSLMSSFWPTIFPSPFLHYPFCLANHFPPCIYSMYSYLYSLDLITIYFRPFLQSIKKFSNSNPVLQNAFRFFPFDTEKLVSILSTPYLNDQNNLRYTGMYLAQHQYMV